MRTLSRGANAAISTGPVEISVTGARQGSVDLMVFQLGADAKVRSVADFVFFNQPASPEGAVRLTAADRVAVDLVAVPASIQALAIAVALDDAVAGSLAAIPGLGVTVTVSAPDVTVSAAGVTVSAAGVTVSAAGVTVAAGAGGPVRADASGLTTERAAVLVEIYRRAGSWKVRNVSAGWARGLSALVVEHGVTVDDAPSQPSQPSQGSGSAPGPAAGPARQVDSRPGIGSRPGTDDRPDVPVPAFARPGGYPPPGGSLPPLSPIDVPRPGGWLPPGGTWSR